MSVNLNYEILSSFSGQQAVLSIPKLYVKFTGCHLRALVLNQIVFYSNKSKLNNGWFYKSYKEWADELCLSESGVRKIIKHFHTKEIIETKTNKIYGKRVLHIKIDIPKFMNLLEQFISQTSQQDSVQELPQTSQQDVSQTSQQDVSIYTDKSSVNTTTPPIFSSSNLNHEPTPVDFIQCFEQTFPENPSPVISAKGSIEKQSLKVIREFKENWREFLNALNAPYEPMTCYLLSGFMITMKDLAPGFCTNKFGKNQDRMNGFNKILHWETVFKIIRGEYK